MTITDVKVAAPQRLLVTFEDGSTLDINLQRIIEEGAAFAPLRNPKVFKMVELGPRGRTILWHVDDDVVDLCADALWLEAHPEERRAD